MKIIIIHVGDVLRCPPVINLINLLGRIGVNTILITTQSKSFNQFAYPWLKTITIPYEYQKKRSVVNKFFDMYSLRNKLWNAIDQQYNNESCLWITTDVTLKNLGNRVLNYRYVLQQMELTEKLYYYNRIPFLRMNENKIGNKAVAVVVPEYLRSHITKAWWDLNKIPLIFSNKPVINTEFVKNDIVTDDYARKVIDKLEGKKIILYQGIIHPERPLDSFIRAISRLGEEYAFVIMSNGEDIYKHLNSRNYYFIPYVAPPDHLRITSHAYIGVLSYFPTRSSQYSILNAVFCAPNKTFEYSMFGIPMIGNDIPGLWFPFTMNNCGTCVSDFSEDGILKAISIVESNYSQMSENALKYYNSVNNEEQLKTIISVINDSLDSRK